MGQCPATANTGVAGAHQSNCAITGDTRCSDEEQIGVAPGADDVDRSVVIEQPRTDLAGVVDRQGLKVEYVERIACVDVQLVDGKRGIQIDRRIGWISVVDEDVPVGPASAVIWHKTSTPIGRRVPHTGRSTDPVGIGLGRQRACENQKG